jgi:hypothetical protein
MKALQIFISLGIRDCHPKSMSMESLSLNPSFQAGCRIHLIV